MCHTLCLGTPGPGGPSSSVSRGHVPAAKTGLRDPRPALGPESQGPRGPSRTQAGLAQSLPWALSQFSPRWTRKVPPGASSRWAGSGPLPGPPPVLTVSRSAWAAPPPGAPSAACLALLPAAPGPSGGGEAGVRARPCWLPPAPSGTPAGKRTVGAWPGHHQGQGHPLWPRGRQRKKA